MSGSGTINGLYRYDGYGFKRFKNRRHDPNSLSHNNVSDIFEDRNQGIWAATKGGGVNYFDTQSGRFIRYTHNPDDPDSLAGDDVFTVFQDSRGNMWFGGPRPPGSTSWMRKPAASPVIYTLRTKNTACPYFAGFGK